jgi:cell division protein FtsQ
MTGIMAARTKSPGKVEKIIKRLFILAGIILTAQFIWLFGISPSIPFSSIEVHGFEGFGHNEILAWAGIGENSSFVTVNAMNTQKVLTSNLLVETARVTKRFPDKLSIFLEPRQPVASALVYINGRQLPLMIDRNGVFYKIGDDITASNLPVLSGFEFDNVPLGLRLPDSLKSLFESINSMSVNSPELLATISEIRIERKAWDRFDLVIFPVHSSIRVRLENNLSEETLRYMLLMLDVISSRPPVPEEIDFSSGMGSFKIKEAAYGN